MTECDIYDAHRPHRDEVKLLPLLRQSSFLTRELCPSVRSTNVYEEKSLGIFAEDDPVNEDGFSTSGHRVTVLGRYLGMHMRKQLSFGT